MTYDCIVIGKGLIGSAAAKYVSDIYSDVAIIGPDEPINLHEATVYASHYDQARVQRIIGTDAVSTLLNKESADAYKKIKNESNISFNQEPGCLYVNPNGMDTYLNNAASLAKEFTTKYKKYNADKLKSLFPDYTFPSSSKAMLEPAPAGFINPRALIQAQLFLTKKNKGHVFSGVAVSIKYRKDHIEIVTENNDIFKTKKVLLCTGAFVNTMNLTPKKLAITLKSETIL